MRKAIIVGVAVILVVTTVVVASTYTKKNTEKQIVQDIESYLKVQQGHHIEGLEGYLSEEQKNLEANYASEDDLYEIHPDAANLTKETEYTKMQLTKCSIGDRVVNTEEGTPEHAEAQRAYAELEEKIREMEQDIDLEYVNKTAVMDIDPDAIDPRVVEENNTLNIRYGDLDVTPKKSDIVDHQGIMKEIRYTDLPKETRKMRQRNTNYSYTIKDTGESSWNSLGKDIKKEGKGVYIIKILNTETQKIKELEVEYKGSELLGIKDLK